MNLKLDLSISDDCCVFRFTEIWLTPATQPVGISPSGWTIMENVSFVDSNLMNVEILFELEGFVNVFIFFP